MDKLSQQSPPKIIKSKVKTLINYHKTRNPFEIAKNLNIHIEYKPYSPYTKGYFIKILRNKFVVINSNLDEYSQNIVMAHELGHAILHSSQNICFIREHTLFPTGILENEANRFAAELLIPDFNIKEYMGYTVEQIASIKKVHPELIRLKFFEYFL